MILDGKKVLVTGAAGLLGTGLVEQLLEEGARVIAVDIEIKSLEEKQYLYKKMPSQLTVVQSDFSDREQLKKIFKNAGDDLTGAVNCAYPKMRIMESTFLMLILTTLMKI